MASAGAPGGKQRDKPNRTMAEDLPNEAERRPQEQKQTGNYRTVTEISYNEDVCLGEGSQGTLVFEGRFGEWKKVAVKRVPRTPKLAGREESFLVKLQEHPNIIRYYHTESDVDYFYIAMQLCDCTVEQYVSEQCKSPPIDRFTLLKQTAAGLKQLHQLSIVHRDIKPQNILLTEVSNGTVVAKIADFGISKQIPQGHQTYTNTSLGTRNWSSPEMLHGSRPTKATDVFSLGCLFHYVLSIGGHPFCDPDAIPKQTAVNIVKGKSSLSADLAKRSTSSPLIKQMIHQDPKQRPTASGVLNHPLFWTPDKTMNFFQVVIDRIVDGKDKDLERRLDERAWEVIGGTEDSPQKWTERIDTSIDPKRFQKVRNTSSIAQLLRQIRNRWHHVQENSILGKTAEQHVKYWTDQFPGLLLRVWDSASELRKEEIFETYYMDYCRYIRNRQSDRD